MAFAIVLLSSIAGLAASLIALIGFDATWSQALVIYLVTTSLPAAVVMAGIYLHMQITRAWCLRNHAGSSAHALNLHRLKPPLSPS